MSSVGFKAAGADVLPRLGCTGYVSQIIDVKTTAKGVYDMARVKVEPYESGRSVIVNVLYQPEWLDGNFDPDSLKEEANGESLFSVYRMHIASRQGLSTLAGLAGSEENFNALADALISSEDKSPEAVKMILSDFFRENGGEIGYVLKQRTRNTEELDDNGKPIKVLENGYEVGEFFYPTEDAKKRLAKRANDGKLVLAFEV